MQKQTFTRSEPAMTYAWDASVTLDRVPDSHPAAEIDSIHTRRVAHTPRLTRVMAALRAVRVRGVGRSR